ncbi:long-chain fatty acid--CoA ligase [Sphingomonas cavernae]|uniref:class I adenylate-forming enzyme family protein n=1 Tax=Sphingomonas cavernae TaxID=2320861 RepID=UPI002683439D
MTTAQAMLDSDFALLSDLFAAQAAERPDAIALVDDDRRLSYAEADQWVDRIAASLQRDGLKPGQAVAIGATPSVHYALVFLGALRAGGAATPLTASAAPAALGGMIADCGSRHLFLDAGMAGTLAGIELPKEIDLIPLDLSSAGTPLEGWVEDEGVEPAPVAVGPDDPFNIIYSSGTTGSPKGIVQSHRMRWGHIRRAGASGYGRDAVTLISTPLYSNTTLVAFVPTLAHGGTAVIMGKFDARRFLELSHAERVTHAMLVPVQYKRLMERADFGDFDLSSYRVKLCTSAPFSAALKADILARWPGGLVEYYGMTEGGGTCILLAHEHPDKLDTVGRPAPGHDIRVIDAAGNELPPGEKGEVVGRSEAMMTGYHNKPDQTREAEWFDDQGNRFIRTGDIGRSTRTAF